MEKTMKTKVISIWDMQNMSSGRGDGFEPGVKYIVINKKNFKIVATFTADDIDDLDPGDVFYTYQKQRLEE